MYPTYKQVNAFSNLCSLRSRKGNLPFTNLPLDPGQNNCLKAAKYSNGWAGRCRSQQSSAIKGNFLTTFHRRGSGGKRDLPRILLKGKYLLKRTVVIKVYTHHQLTSSFLIWLSQHKITRFKVYDEGCLCSLSSGLPCHICLHLPLPSPRTHIKTSQKPCLQVWLTRTRTGTSTLQLLVRLEPPQYHNIRSNQF